MEGGGPPAGANMGAILSSMSQSAGADPSQRLMGALPPLGGQLVQFGQGFHEKQLLPAFFLAMSAQGGFYFGLFGSGAHALFQGLFMDMSSFASAFIGDSGVEGAPIEGGSVEGAPIAAASIDAPPISAPSGGSSILQDVSQISTPRISTPEIAAATSIRSPSVS